MSKQKTYQKYIFKLHSSDILAAPHRHLTRTLEEARMNDEIIALGDRAVIRFIDEINGIDISEAETKIRTIRKEIKALQKQKKSLETKKKIKALYGELDKIQFKSDYLAVIMDKPSDFKKINKGFCVNGTKYRRLVGTPNGVKKSTVVYASELSHSGKEIHKELSRRLENGRNPTVEMVPAKYEAYKALACSSSAPVSLPRGILVVDDAVTHFKEKVISLDDRTTDEPVMTIEEQDIELIDSDGYGLICPSLALRWSQEMGEKYIMSGCCIRNAFLKGMVFTFDFHSFCEEYSGDKIICDVWGKPHNINDVEIILTTSMLKLWSSYDSLDDYLSKCDANKYTFAITKVLPDKLENERHLNYQFIQGYELNDEQIEDLIKPTISEIKEVINGDVNKMILFLKGMGMSEDNIRSVENDFAKAVMIDPQMMNDDYVINRLNYMLKKTINEAKIGVLKIHGNYAVISGDPVVLCQKTFRINVPNEKMGLLKAGEMYSEYWADLSIPEVVCFRAPMSCH